LIQLGSHEWGKGAFFSTIWARNVPQGELLSTNDVAGFAVGDSQFLNHPFRKDIELSLSGLPRCGSSLQKLKDFALPFSEV
jgi:hypothetical protein